jgi:hypothetical protein
MNLASNAPTWSDGESSAVQARKLQERSNRLPKVVQKAPDWKATRHP